MKNKILVLCTAVAFASLIHAPETAVADDHNPLRDAGFELQLPPDQGGWGLFEISSFADKYARSGSHSMYNGGFSRAVSYPPYFFGIVSGSFQEFPAGPGSRWQLTGYGFAPTEIQGAPAFGIVQVSFFDAEGNDLGTIETTGDDTTRAKISNKVNSQTPAGEWIFLDTGVATAPVGTETVQAFTLYVDYSGSNIPQGVYFDDLRLRELEEDN